MARTDFYYDAYGEAKHPPRAIAILRGEQGDVGQRNSLVGLWNGQPHPRQAQLAAYQAILMMGTTGDLQQALDDAIAQGLVGIETPGDQVAIWYLRRKAGSFTKSVVSIAPLGGYWGLEANDPSQVPGGWVSLFNDPLPVSAIGLGRVKEVLRGGQGVAAWYSDDD